MRNFTWSFLTIFCLVFNSFSQTNGIEKGSYMSTNKGQQIKLNLLDNNKYELVFSSGNYEIKGDSLLFINDKKESSVFELDFKRQKNAKKIKIKFLDSSSLYSLYLGTQNGSNAVNYQRISDIQYKINPDYDKKDLEFEIDRADYLYLVNEGYYDAQTQISKYELPKDVAEITINYKPNLLSNLNIQGYLDKKTNELRISEKAGLNPLVFINEKEVTPAKKAVVTALENKTVSNWTYPGKEPLIADDFGTTIDTAAVTVDSAYSYSNYNFKFKIESSLKNAITSTKTAKNKFLVVYSDSKNPSAKADFDAFITGKQTDISYYMYNGYEAQYDTFNYYLAGAEDKKWLKSNKTTDVPSIIILNGEGDVLATAKSTLNDENSKLTYFDELYKDLQRTDALYAFSKTVKNKKAADADLILALDKAAALELPYTYDTAYTVDNVENPSDFKFVKTAVDKKEVSQIWKKLIEAHQKDKQPNMLLVSVILKEIKNQGFYKQFFKEDRVLNYTDFLAVDYLIKHYDAIEKANAAAVNETSEDAVSPAIAINLSSEISSALEQNSYVPQEKTGSSNSNKIIATYKKLIAIGKGDFDCYKNYLAYLSQEAEKTSDYITYLREFNTYFNTYLSDKGNAIVKLDEMFTALNSSSEYYYDGWSAFKEYHSNICNSAAWSVVEKPANSSFLKSAIEWSEYSLIVNKNNPYYLDTLAQLYYKDGQKQKGIETQALAVKFLSNVVEEETASEIRETLNKMQNGTY
ncbi:hypothetical protein [Flavobacterium reichenbachii]|uniref:Uncharacterized protein n=1 Tax=Flavobacterium reichenbachii TaxID=362418 RepID=A0A085ZRD2_9FLAO|nr:hypothetical protein [Flavobacterium reichenbachii]KFF06996.1 hypothetical protein IW19_16405 [Flavobacterium reichenbachii]OXB12031.1 hypothetical protein B0A68_20095 [Flavobacterium reichenbachii]